MTPKRSIGAMALSATLATALLTACGTRDTKNAEEDLGKMDEAMEARAAEIEQRADDAAAAVEREAQAELERVENEAKANAPSAADRATDADTN